MMLITDADEAFDDRYISTIGVDFRIKTLVRQQKTVKLQIWDTAGQERFRAITTSYYRGADGILMVYDVTDPSSLTSLGEVWIREVRNYASKKPRVLLVGNKADLKRQQAPAAAALVAEQLLVLLELLAEDGVVACVEASAKDGVGVALAFDGLVDHMVDAYATKQRLDATFKAQGQAGAAQGRHYSRPITSASLYPPAPANNGNPRCCNLL
jgi:small GTP-binding protein